jgi:hypothetical protein
MQNLPNRFDHVVLWATRRLAALLGGGEGGRGVRGSGLLRAIRRKLIRRPPPKQRHGSFRMRQRAQLRAAETLAAALAPKVRRHQPTVWAQGVVPTNTRTRDSRVLCPSQHEMHWNFDRDLGSGPRCFGSRSAPPFLGPGQLISGEPPERWSFHCSGARTLGALPLRADRANKHKGERLKSPLPFLVSGF